jgi:hypothetical protein
VVIAAAGNLAIDFQPHRAFPGKLIDLLIASVLHAFAQLGIAGQIVSDDDQLEIGIYLILFQIRLQCARFRVPQLCCLFSLPVSTRRPSGEKATLNTRPQWPENVRSSSPVSASQSFAVLSELPVTTRPPSGEKATLVT